MAVDVSAPFPQVDLQPLSTITVTLTGGAAVITALNVHGYQDDSVSNTPPKLDPVRGAYTTA
jgi:hypothetical protein